MASQDQDYQGQGLDQGLTSLPIYLPISWICSISQQWRWTGIDTPRYPGKFVCVYNPRKCPSSSLSGE